MKNNAASVSTKTTVDRWVNEKLASISDAVKWAVGTSFVLGFIIHIASIAGGICNWDSVLCLLDDSSYLVAQGKWFFPVVQIFKGYVGWGSLSGPIALAWISVSAGLTVSILDIKKPLFGALTGALMSSFLPVMCTFSYSGEDGFFFSLLLSTLCVYVTINYKRGFIPGIIMLTLSLGIYQAYIGYAAGLFVLYSLIQLMSTRRTEKDIALKGLGMVGVLAAAVVLYCIVLKVVLKITSTELSNYHNIDEIFVIASFVDIIKLVVFSFVRLAAFFFVDQYGGHTIYFSILYSSVIILIGVFAVCAIRKSRVYQDKKRMVLELFVLAMLPFAVNAIAILSKNPSTHWLMKYPIILIFILPLKFADMGADLLLFGKKKKSEYSGNADAKPDSVITAAQWAAVIISMLLVCSWGVYTNHGYTRLTVAYEGAYAECIDMAGRIERVYSESPEEVQEEVHTSNQELWINGKTIPRVMVMAERGTGSWMWYEYEDMFAYMDPYTGIQAKTYLRSAQHYEYMLKNYLGKDYIYADQELHERIGNDPAFKEMPQYPAAGCVEVIDGWIVVKI